MWSWLSEGDTEFLDVLKNMLTIWPALESDLWVWSDAFSREYSWDYSQHQNDLYYVIIDLKKAFDRCSMSSMCYIEKV